jgi:hypothetical protein
MMGRWAMIRLEVQVSSGCGTSRTTAAADGRSPKCAQRPSKGDPQRSVPENNAVLSSLVKQTARHDASWSISSSEPPDQPYRSNPVDRIGRKSTERRMKQ